MRYQMVIGLAAALSLSVNGLANELEHGDCETASNWAGAEPAWYSELCDLPAPHAGDTIEGVGGSTAEAYMLNFGSFSDPGFTGVITYPMPDITNFTQIGPDASSLFSADFDQQSEVLYAIHNDNFSLGTVDLGTGAFNEIAVITGADAGQTLTGLAWDPTDGTWYLTAGSILYTIDVNTAEATEIGTADVGGETLIEIKFDSSGQLYATTLEDNLWAVDKTDASSTLIGALGFDINFAQGMAYDYSTDTMWAWLYQGSGAVDWATIDLSTGAAASVESYTGDGPEASGGILGGFTGGPGEVPESQPVPTLGTWGLIGLVLLLGLVAVTAVRRARA